MRQNFGSTPLNKWKRLGSKVVNASNFKAWKSSEADPISSSIFSFNENKTLIIAPAKTKQNQTEHTKHEPHRCLLQDDMSKTWEVMTQIKTSKNSMLERPIWFVGFGRYLCDFSEILELALHRYLIKLSTTDTNTQWIEWNWNR